MTQRDNHPSHSQLFNRRTFLGAAAAAGALATDMTQLNLLKSQALGAELKQRGKRVILLWLAGGASQLETWDPKPGRPTGGPFRAIKTAVPGIHISELMPKMAKRIKHTAIIRSLNTGNGSHGGGARLMHLGLSLIHIFEHFIKDMGIALDEAKRMGLSLPGLALGHQLYLALQAQGHGRDGTHALQLALASLSGIDWKSR